QMQAHARTPSGVESTTRVVVGSTSSTTQVGTLGLVPQPGGQPRWLPEFDDTPGVNDWVEASASFDDGSGSALYVGGDFTVAGSLPANHVARWNGSAWSSLGSGTDGVVQVLTTFDDGNGRALYAGGFFTSAGSVPAGGIARWDGASWSALGAGTNGG